MAHAHLIEVEHRLGVLVGVREVEVLLLVPVHVVVHRVHNEILGISVVDMSVLAETEHPVQIGDRDLLLFKPIAQAMVAQEGEMGIRTGLVLGTASPDLRVTSDTYRKLIG